jgi:SAM-dependent methyltransferase
VNESTRQQLLQINSDFYNSFADSFAGTRYGAQPGWDRIIPHFPAPCQVLDLGCGNGRFAHFLDERLDRVGYTGLDGSERLIEIARQRAEGLTRTSALFHAVDLTQPDWEQPHGSGGFDVVVALAVMHHIPSIAARSAFLRAAASCLAPTGVLILSNWRFAHNARMRAKIVPWQQVGLTDDDVEPDDYLLDWKAGGNTGYRYAHQLGEAEVAELAQEVGLIVSEQFHADGREGDLSLYSVLRYLR